MKWWNDIWLNEGFANFLEIFGASHFMPELRMYDLQVVTGWQMAINLDSMYNSHPIQQNVDKTQDIEELFDTISYNKGAAILRMIHDLMGHDVFFKSLRSYIKKFRFANADTNDLWDCMNQFYDQPYLISEVMTSWTNQRGFPLVRVSLSNDSTHLIFNQMSYLKAKLMKINKRDEINPTENSWIIPVKYITNNHPNNSKTIWINHNNPLQLKINYNNDDNKINRNEEDDKNKIIDGKMDDFKWIKTNDAIGGFYVTDYDDVLWNRLSEQLLNDHLVFTEVNRAGILHDAFKLTCDGLMSVSILLNLTRYLKYESAYLPWTVVRNKYSCITDILEDKDTQRHWKMYLWIFQQRIMDFKVLNSTNHKQPFEIFQQYEIYLYALKHGALSDFKNYIQSIFKKIVSDEPVYESPEIRTLALLHGFNRTNIEDHTILMELLEKSNNDFVRKILMKSLAIFSTKSAIDYNLRLALDQTKIKQQDAPLFIGAIARSIDNREVMWNFLVTNWEILHTRYAKGGQLFDIISSIVSNCDTVEELVKVQHFFSLYNKNHKFISYKQIIERIEMNIKKVVKGRLNHSSFKVLDWLKEQIIIEKTSNPANIHV